MKRIISMICIFPIFALCKTTEISYPSRMLFSDTEVSTNVSYSVSQELGFSFSLMLPYSTCQSNNVEIAFGKDDFPQNNQLSTYETFFKIGYDAGQCVLQDSNGNLAKFNPLTHEEESILSAQAEIGKDGFANRLTISENQIPLLTTTNLNFINFHEIDRIKTVIRGTEVSHFPITIKTAKRGSTIIVR